MVKPLHILVDSGSTHNFLDSSLAHKLGCIVEDINPQVATVADGSHIACNQVCKEFSWEMNGIKFFTKVMLIPLGSCDWFLQYND